MTAATTKPDLLTPEQVAEMLQVHPGTLENWRYRGEGPPFVKLGNGKRSAVRYPRDKLDTWIWTNIKRGSES